MARSSGKSHRRWSGGIWLQSFSYEKAVCNILVLRQSERLYSRFLKLAHSFRDFNHLNGRKVAHAFKKCPVWLEIAYARDSREGGPSNGPLTLRSSCERAQIYRLIVCPDDFFDTAVLPASISILLNVKKRKKMQSLFGKIVVGGTNPKVGGQFQCLEDKSSFVLVSLKPDSAKFRVYQGMITIIYPIAKYQWRSKNSHPVFGLLKHSI